MRSKGLLRMIHHLGSRLWFRRVWVVQELALARTATIHAGCGDIIVGLLGINFPCLLGKTGRYNDDTGGWVLDEEERYKSINVAGLPGHVWGHDFLGNRLDSAEVLEELNEGKRQTVQEAKRTTGRSWLDYKEFGVREYVFV